MSVIFTSPFKVVVPIIKVVGDFCNLRCRYCFYNTEDQLTSRIMSDELLDKFLEEYIRLFTNDIMFIWHGGEPLLAGLSFFQKIVNLQTKYRKSHQIIKNNIQTNATLINDDWAKFFKAHNFRVGVSLDGDKKSHDFFRINNAGHGSFDQAIKGIEILRRYGIEPGIIQTITRGHLNRVREDFIFFC